MKNALLEDLALDFVLPGFVDWDLKVSPVGQLELLNNSKESGCVEPVTMDNLEEYIRGVVNAYLRVCVAYHQH